MGMEGLLEDPFILNNIFNIIPIDELDEISLVCNRFKNHIRSEQYWYQRLVYYYPNNIIAKPSYYSWKIYYISVNNQAKIIQTIIQCMNHIANKLEILINKYNDQEITHNQQSIEELNEKEQEERLNKIQNDIQKWKEAQKKHEMLALKWNHENDKQI
jgi:hypothetical protein